MNILITNDDGISAEGIAVLAKAALPFGKVTVVAPAHQCSAMSHRITVVRPMVVGEYDFPVEGAQAYSVDGTPADCVKAALDVILPERPDVVLSGINHGYNVGFEIAYSGTVGAAMEALMNGIPAIAFSRNDAGTFDAVEANIGAILERLLPAPPSCREIWNVNFPGGEARGILWNRTVAPGGYYIGSLRASHEDGKTILRYPPALDVDNTIPRGPEDSDLHAVISGYISVGKVLCPVL